MDFGKHESLSNIAYNYILERIISFEFTPNDPIVEQDICNTLGISRTPLREALRRLEAEGFVTKIRNKGTFVRTYSQENIRESIEIRILFETHSLRKCIKYVDPSEVQAVKKTLLELTPSSPREAYYHSDTMLHNMITKYCMNTKIRSILHSLEVQIDSAQKISAQTPNRLLQSRDEHLAIIQAIEEVNLDQATKALKEHLENVEQSYIRAFQKMRMEKLGEYN